MTTTPLGAGSIREGEEAARLLAMLPPSELEKADFGLKSALWSRFQVSGEICQCEESCGLRRFYCTPAPERKSVS